MINQCNLRERSQPLNQCELSAIFGKIIQPMNALLTGITVFSLYTGLF